jgi:hypothetical protein
VKRVPRWWRAPLWTFSAIFLTAGPLGYFGRDFGVFLLTLLFYLPLVAAISMILLIMAIFASPASTRRTALASLVVIVLSAPTTLLVLAKERDRIAFLFWSQTHRTLLSDWTGKRGVVVNWDSWGFGGISGDSFLISAPSDTVGDAKAIAATSVPCLEPDCIIGDGKRMETGFFIVSISGQ